MQQGDASFGRAARCSFSRYRPLQLARRRVDADQALGPTLADQTRQQLAFAAAEIGDDLGAVLPQRLHHATIRSSLSRIGPSSASSGAPALGPSASSCVSGASRASAARASAGAKIAPDDQLPRRMAVEPAFAAASSLAISSSPTQ